MDRWNTASAATFSEHLDGRRSFAGSGPARHKIRAAHPGERRGGSSGVGHENAVILNRCRW